MRTDPTPAAGRRTQLHGKAAPAFAVLVAGFLCFGLCLGCLASPAAAQSVVLTGPSQLAQNDFGSVVSSVPVTWSVLQPGRLNLVDVTASSVTVIAGFTAGTFTLQGQSASGAVGTLAITVQAAGLTIVTPTSGIIANGQQLLLSASAPGSSSPFFVWFSDTAQEFVGITDPSTQNASFEYQIGAPGGTFRVFVSNAGDPSGIPAIALVTVVDVEVRPTTASVLPGTTRQFMADLTGSQQSLQWSSTIPGASISARGLLTVPAGAAAGSYTVTVQTVGTPVATATATVAVVTTMPVSGVAVDPLNSLLSSGQQEQFTAVVGDPNGEPHPNQTVTWSVTGPATATVGASGMFTAPATPGVYTVTATSQADASKSASATVTVGEELTILPASASLSPAATQTFTAMVSGVPTPAVTWSIAEGAAGGTISTSGAYTAPATAGDYHVVASATDAGSTVRAMATVSVRTAPQLSIAVSPTETSLAIGGMQQFAATVTGAADTTVVWSASAGSIDPTGLFTAPANDGTVTVTATSHANSQVQAQATVVVTALGQGQAFQYDANGNLLSDGSRTYEWDAENRITAINIATHRSEFSYDGAGNRVLITEKDNGAVTTSRHYIWGIANDLLEETDATSTPSGSPGAGSFDSLDCNQLIGWAWSSASPNTPISVDIYDGSTKIASTLASTFRSDLRVAGAGDGDHGFFFPTPAALKTGASHSVTVKLGGTSTALGTRTVTCSSPTFGGFLDGANCSQIAGWAWDSAQPNSPINVDIYDGTTLVTTAVASGFRQDLENAGIGNGNHGFSIPTPAVLKNGAAHSITIKSGGTGTVLGGPTSLTCSAPSFAGSFDAADCMVLSGWVWDANQPNAGISVDIYDGTTLLGTAVANVFRQDLLSAGLGNGKHGFTYSTPALYTGASHSISLHYGGTSTVVAASPKSITCPKETILTRFFPGGMQSTGGAPFYFTFDHLGSVREVTDGSGNVVDRYDYDAYGRLTVNQGTPPRVGFADYYYHQPSGLSLTKYRAYDPDLGRWASRDPIGVFGGPNLYAYLGSNPINAVDPLGLWRIWDYAEFNINIGEGVSWSGTLTVDRYGNVYWSPVGIGIGKAPIVAGFSMTYNWINIRCTPSKELLNNFLTAHGLSATAGLGYGMTEAYTPGVGTATGIGIVSPQFGGSYNYSWVLGQVGGPW